MKRPQPPSAQAPLDNFPFAPQYGIPLKLYEDNQMSDSNKPSIEDKVESAVDRTDDKVSPFLDKYGLKIVIGVLVAVVIVAFAQRML